MKVNLWLVTYDSKGRRTEQLFNELPEEEKKKIGQELTDKFMKRAGFSPVMNH